MTYRYNACPYLVNRISQPFAEDADAVALIKSGALHLMGDAGIVTIQALNGIGPYTGYNFLSRRDY